MKNEATIIKTTNPTNPPLPSPFIKFVKLSITLMLKIAPPVSTSHRTVRGINPIKNEVIPLTNPLT